MMYVAFEGGEGAGKSTVSKKVATALRGVPYNLEVVEVREPGGTDAGESIRSILLLSEMIADRTEAALFAASRAELVARVVRPALERNAVVVSDRSVYSSLAYQGAARGLGVPEVRAINHFALDGLFPECVVYLRSQDGVKRETKKNRISNAGTAFHEAVLSGYDALAEEEPEHFVVIDASKPLYAVVKESLDALTERWGL